MRERNGIRGRSARCYASRANFMPAAIMVRESCGYVANVMPRCSALRAKVVRVIFSAAAPLHHRRVDAGGTAQARKAHRTLELRVQRQPRCSAPVLTICLGRTDCGSFCVLVLNPTCCSSC